MKKFMIVALFAILALVIGHAQAQGDIAAAKGSTPTLPTLSYKCCKSVSVEKWTVSGKEQVKYTNCEAMPVAGVYGGTSNEYEKPFGGACCVPVVIATYGSSSSGKGVQNPESEIIAVLDCNGDIDFTKCKKCVPSFKSDQTAYDTSRNCNVRKYELECNCKGCNDYH